jgi:hypothetical protein
MPIKAPIVAKLYALYRNLLTDSDGLPLYLVTKEGIESEPRTRVSPLQVNSTRGPLQWCGDLAADAHEALCSEVLQLHNIAIVQRSPIAVAQLGVLLLLHGRSLLVGTELRKHIAGQHS